MAGAKGTKKSILKFVGVCLFCMALPGAAYFSDLSPIKVDDIADGIVDDVLGWDGSGVAVSQSREGARAFHNASQSIANNSLTTVAFNDEEYDDNALHDTSTNNSRITIQTAGRYIVAANIDFAISSVGDRLVRFRVNGTTDIAHVGNRPPASGNAAGISVSTIRNFSASDYIEVRVYQDSGGSLNILSNGRSPFFMVQRARDQ